MLYVAVLLFELCISYSGASYTQRCYVYQQTLLEQYAVLNSKFSEASFNIRIFVFETLT